MSRKYSNRHVANVTYMVILLIIVGCRVSDELLAPEVSPFPLSPTPIAIVAVPTETSAPTEQSVEPAQLDQLQIGFEPTVPDGVREQLANWPLAAHANAAQVRIALNQGKLLGHWVYALVAPFPTVTDGVSLAEVQARWRSEQVGLVVSAETYAVFAHIWGTPTRGVEIVANDALNNRLWQRDGVWAIVPFAELTPDLKVIAVAGQSPLNASLDVTTYPLAVAVGAVGQAEWGEAFNPDPIANWDSTKMTRIAMTGVTALVRSTAYRMEDHGVLYPGEEVAGVLQAADISHISNEVSFTADCPFPNPVDQSTGFCSADKYFELLTHLGIDIVELTGNHVNDWGADQLVRTIGMYEEAGMRYFGGGVDSADAANPAIIEHNGNRIAFVGCNHFGPAYAWASNIYAGSRICDGGLPDQIAQLREAGNIVIMTLQYGEFYHYEPTGSQIVDFQRYAEAGAHVVSGSQGHHAQSFALHNDSIIHYGLGNLFFDQMFSMGTRQTFIDNYIVYDGKLISLTLDTFLIEDYARPRMMDSAERIDLLNTVFDASLWP